MAAKGRFRIPTAKEMEKLDTGGPSVMPLFKRDESSKPKSTTEKNVVFEAKRAPVVPHVSENSVSTTDTSMMPPKKQHEVDFSKMTDESIEQKPTLRKDAVLQPITKPTKAGNCVIVNPRQRGNPIIKHIRSIPWEFGDTPADYEMGKATCALYLSIQYHQRNPEYIHERLKKLGRAYDVRVLLVQVDNNNPHHALKELAKICILADLTLMLAFSHEEAGRYLETYKIYENKPPDALMEKTEDNFLAKFTDCLTAVKSVNKSDCMTLLSKFKSFEMITKQSVEGLSLCPGFGPQKAQRLYNVLNEPFLKSTKRKNDSQSASAAVTEDTSENESSPAKQKK